MIMETPYDIVTTGGPPTKTNFEGAQPKSFEARTDGRRNARKTVGSDKILSVTAGSIPNSSIDAALISYVRKSITVSAGQTSGNGSVTSGSVIAGYVPNAQDQMVKSILLSGTTLTVTLAAAASADNVFIVFLFNP